MTGPNPILEAVEDDFTRAGRWTAAHFSHHRHPQTPATTPVNLAAAPAAAAKQEDTMSLATLEDDVKADLTDGLNWMEGFVNRVRAAAPGIIATSDALASSTVGQVAEMFLGKVLPPDVEAELLGIVRRYVTTFGQAAPVPVQQPVPAQ